MTRPIYIADEVREVHALHPYLREPAFRTAPIRDQVDQQAKTLTAAHEAGDPRVRMHILSWCPGAAEKTLAQILASPFSAADARLTMSREYGFSTWEAVTALGDLTSDPDFETALDHMLDGDIESLTADLGRRPQLVTERSLYGHRSTLLHYLAANGVESHRQQMPLNAADIAKLLVANGASKTAKATMYGGGQTALALAQTSAHPLNAGISDALTEVLTPE